MQSVSEDAARQDDPAVVLDPMHRVVCSSRVVVSWWEEAFWQSWPSIRFVTEYNGIVLMWQLNVCRACGRGPSGCVVHPLPCG